MSDETRPPRAIRSLLQVPLGDGGVLAAGLIAREVARADVLALDVRVERALLGGPLVESVSVWELGELLRKSTVVTHEVAEVRARNCPPRYRTPDRRPRPRVHHQPLDLCLCFTVNCQPCLRELCLLALDPWSLIRDLGRP